MKRIASGFNVPKTLASPQNPIDCAILLISKSFTSSEINQLHSLAWSLGPNSLIGTIVDTINSQDGFALFEANGTGFVSSQGQEHRKKQVGRWHLPGSKPSSPPAVFGSISKPTVGLNQSVVPDNNLSRVGSFLTFSDDEPYDIYRYLMETFPLAPKLGLIGSKTPFVNGLDTTLFYNDKILDRGSVGVALDETKSLKQMEVGLVEIGSEMEITQCRGNIVLKIDGNSASKELVQQMQSQIDKYSPESSMLVAKIRDGDEIGIFQVTGGDITKGTLAIDTKTDLQPGMKITFLQFKDPAKLSVINNSLLTFGTKSQHGSIDTDGFVVQSEQGMLVSGSGVLDKFQLINVPNVYASLY